MMKSLLAHFFLADMRDGLGPFLGVFLQEKAWSPAEIRPGCTTKSCHGPSKVANADNTAEDTRRCSGFTARSISSRRPETANQWHLGPDANHAFQSEPKTG
jgi:hypothetical protein